MRKKSACILLVFVILLTFIPINITNAENGAEEANMNFSENIKKDYKLKYNYPTTETYAGWEKEALPLGNGTLGYKIFGLIGKERIQFNEKTLWSGGPRPDDNTYNGGNYTDRYKYIPQIRQALENGNLSRAKSLAEIYLIGPQNEQYGRYLSFGDILIDFTNQDVAGVAQEYERSLDLNDAIHKVSYIRNNTRYTRESFVSYPDNVGVTRFEKNGDQSLDFTVDLQLTKDLESNGQYSNFKSSYKSGTTRIDSDGLMLTGKVNNNDMKFASYLYVDTDGDKKVQNNKIVVTNASYANIIHSAKTDYALDYSTNYRDKEINVEEYVKERVNSARQTSFEELKQNHVDDYKNLFNRMQLNISEENSNYTNILLKNYKLKPDNYLEELFFQYGRYLLIASSRDGKNSLPANLQGVWNAIDNPPWNSDYHMNVNLQMNYWPAYSTNLRETSYPLINFVDDLRYYGRVSAKEYAGISSDQGHENGWLAHTQITPFGWSTPGWNYYWGWSPAANAWIMQNVYDYYRYSKDTDYLISKIYPMLRETALFWNSFLHYDRSSDRYVSSPSYSPEHGTITIGNTFDQSLIWQLFRDFIEAANDLNLDAELVRELSAKIEKLKPLNINNNGMIKEWYEEDTRQFTGEGVQREHRHVSHLVGLFPGSLFDTEKTEFIEAAKKSLNDRGDGGTGWSKANKINLWARLNDGDRALKLLSEQLKNSTHNNLWDTHPPYQIDGNLGATSGVAEMILQSHLDKITLLPALPQRWQEGSVRGIMARGNFEVAMNWSDSQIIDAQIRSLSGGDLILEYPNISTGNIELNGEDVDFEIVNSDQIKIETNVDDIVNISSIKPTLKEFNVVRIGKYNARLSFSEISNADKYVIERQVLSDSKEWIDDSILETVNTIYLDEDIKPEHSYRYRVSVVENETIITKSNYSTIDKYNSIIDDRDPRIQYGEAYYPWDDSALYLGTQTDGDLRKVSGNYEEAGKLSFDFYGNAIKIYGIKSVALGQARVFIDGKEKDVLDFYKNGETEKSVLIGEYNNLELDNHTIEIKVVKDSNPGIPKITVDYFEILENLETQKLEELINTVTEILIDKDKYTVDSVEKLEKALQEANSILVKENILQNEINNAYNNLKIALEELANKPIVIKENLKQTYDLINSLIKDIKDNFTDESIEALMIQLSKSKDVLEDVLSTQDVVDTALEDLNNSYNNLRLKEVINEVNTSQIDVLSEKIYKKLEEIGDKLTDESKANLLKALNNANELLSSEDLTQEKVDEEVLKLIDAFTLIEFKQDQMIVTSALVILLKNANSRLEKDLEDESLENLEKAISKAKEIIEKEGLTAEEYNEVYRELVDALLNSKIKEEQSERPKIHDLKAYTIGATNVRTEPNGKIIGTLKIGTVVDGEYDEGSNWVKFNHYGQLAYVYKPLLSETVEVKGFASGNTNIRQTPNGRIVGQLGKSDYIEGVVNISSSSWIRIIYKGQDAYIYRSLIKDSVQLSAKTTGTVNVRQTPNGKIIGALKTGSPVNAKTSVNFANWLEIQYNGQRAYIYKAYVK